LTIRRYEALQRHWAKYPPLPRLAAWHFGLGKEETTKSKSDDFAAFFQEMTGAAPPV